MMSKDHGLFEVGFSIIIIHLFWLCWVVFVALRLSLLAASRGYFLPLLPRLLVVAASLVSENRLESQWAPYLQITGSRA